MHLKRKSVCAFLMQVFCVTVYMFGSVKEMAGIRNISRGVAPYPEGGLETKDHPHSQGNM